MNIRQLRIFQSVCEEGNITKAAQKLYMSQPAVSHVIHELEEELGSILFDRIGKRIYINEVGRLFLQRVERMLLSYDELEKGIPLLEEEAMLRIGSSITIANDWLPKAMATFQKEYPKTPVQVYVDSAKKILDKLLRHEIDIALIEGVVSDERLEWITFDSYKLYVICSIKNVLAKRKEITCQELQQQTWLLREVGSAARDTFDSALLVKQISVTPTWTSINSQALIQAVKQDLGLSVLPDRLLHDRDLDEITPLRIKGIKLINENHIVYQKGIYLTKAIKNFMNIMKS